MAEGSACDIGGGSLEPESGPTCGVPTPDTGPGDAGRRPGEGLFGPLRRLGTILFGLDMRSLAAFRVGLAVLVLCDLWFRLPGLTAFYTDQGLLTRAEQVEADLGDPWHFSLHMASGAAWLQILLFASAFVCAIMLLAGWRTRLATVLSWVLLVSLQTRNPLVLQGGDVLLRCLLFWGMWLPLGVAWSVDRARATDVATAPARIANVSSLALILQVCFLYWFTSALKTHEDWRVDHTAVFYALSIDQFATPFGHWLLQFRGLLKGLTAATILQEAWGPFLLFVPALAFSLISLRLAERAGEWGRMLAVVLFVGFHLGLASTMELGPFPYICWVAWLPFLPALFWDGLARRFQQRWSGLQLWYDGDCGFCKAMIRLIQTFWLIPSPTVRACQEDPSIEADMRLHDSWVVVGPAGDRHVRFDGVAYAMRHSPLLWPLGQLLRLPPLMAVGTRAYRWVAKNRGAAAHAVFFMRPAPLRAELSPRTQLVQDALAAFLLYYVLLWNWRTMHLNDTAWIAKWFPTSENWIVEIPRLDQYWSMFSPMPLHDDGWYLAAATLADGSVVDLLTAKPPVDTQPTRVSAMYRDERWRKYLMNLYTVEFARWRKNYARWLVDDWNERHAADATRKVVSLDLYFWKKTNRYDGEPTMSKDLLIHFP